MTRVIATRRCLRPTAAMQQDAAVWNEPIRRTTAQLFWRAPMLIAEI